MQKIPVVETPSTAFSGADKENICAFQFGPAITVNEYTVSQELEPQEPQESQEVNMEDEDKTEEALENENVNVNEETDAGKEFVDA